MYEHYSFKLQYVVANYLSTAGSRPCHDVSYAISLMAPRSFVPSEQVYISIAASFFNSLMESRDVSHTKFPHNFHKVTITEEKRNIALMSQPYYYRFCFWTHVQGNCTTLELAVPQGCHVLDRFVDPQGCWSRHLLLATVFPRTESLRMELVGCTLYCDHYPPRMSGWV